MTLHLSPKGRLQKRRAKLLDFNLKRLSLAFTLFFAALSLACTMDERQSGIPSKAQETINAFTEDFNAGRFDKIYKEAAEEWRAAATDEQSSEIFRRLKERLGLIKERAFTSGRQQQMSGQTLPPNSLVIRYNTRFDKSDGMEVFTLIERDGRYQLAGYSVSSDILK